MKLYWRVKINNKWTYIAADYLDEIENLGVYTVIPLELKE